MTNLPPRKFQLNGLVWVTIGEMTYHGKVIGYEDGRNYSSPQFVHYELKGPYQGWIYHITLYGKDGEMLESRLIEEEELQPANTTG